MDYDTYISQIGEQTSNGGYAWECDVHEATLKCPEFREPGITKANQSNKALFKFTNLLAANAEKIAIYETTGAIPPLEQDDTRYRTAESKACDIANAGIEERSEDYISFLRPGEIASQRGPFGTNNLVEIITRSNYSGSHLVCIFLCVNCSSENKFDSEPDAGIVAKSFNAGIQRTSSRDNAFGPPEGSSIVNNLPNFRWPGESSLGPDSKTGALQDITYSFFLQDATSGKTIISERGLVYPSYQVTKPLKFGTYKYNWRVARNGIGEPWSKTITFKIELPPNQLISPISESDTATPAFRWSNSWHFDNQLFVSRSSQKSLPLIDIKQLYDFSFEALSKTLQYGEAYSWWVRPSNNGIAAPSWGPEGKFKIVPRKTELLSPVAQTDSLTPVFLGYTPKSKGETIKHRFWVESVSPKKKLVDRTVNGNTLVSPVTLVEGQEYAVWVQPNINGVNGTWSKEYRLKATKNPDPKIPYLIEPYKTKTETLQPRFDWTHAAGATGYEIWIDDIDSKRNLVNTKVSGATYTHPTVFKAGQRIRVWIRALLPAPYKWSPGVDYECSED